MAKIPEGSCACVRNPRNKQYYLICREKGERLAKIKRRCTPQDKRRHKTID